MNENRNEAIDGNFVTFFCWEKKRKCQKFITSKKNAKRCYAMLAILHRNGCAHNCNYVNHISIDCYKLWHRSVVIWSAMGQNTRVNLIKSTVFYVWLRWMWMFAFIFGLNQLILEHRIGLIDVREIHQLFTNPSVDRAF